MQHTQHQRPLQRLWHNRDYVLLWSGQLLSTTGSQISQLAFPLLVLALTNSPAQAGLTATLRALPYLLLSLPAGAIIDRWDRKRVMLFCELGRAISLASIPLAFLIFQQVSIIQLNSVACVEGTLFVFFNIAEVACLPRIVSKEQLPTAVAQNEVALYMTSLAGPFLGSILYTAQRLLPFLVDALSYLVSVGTLFFIRAPFQEARTTSFQSLRQEIAEGLTWIWKHKAIRFLALLSAGSNLLSSSYTLFILLFAQRLHMPSSLIGLIFTAGGLGGIVGAFLASPIQKRLGFWLTMAGSMWVWAVLTALYSVAFTPILLGLVTFLLFFLWPICNTAQMSYRLQLIPDHLQGRVNSAFRLLALSGQPVGLALTGILTERLGIDQTVLLTACGLALIALCATLNTSLRTLSSQKDERNDIEK